MQEGKRHESVLGRDAVNRKSLLDGSSLSRRDFLRLSGTGIAGTLLLGGVSCGGGQGSSKTLTYWASNQGATMNEDRRLIGEAVKDFKKQTGITVNFKVISWADLWTKITTAVTSGQGPDVLNIGNTWAASLQATGAFVPFDQGALNTVGGKGKFVPAAFAASGAPGKTPTSVPLYGLSYALFYNKAMFQEAGIGSPPKTWDEFLAIAKELTNPPGRWGLGVEGASITENSHWAFILGQQQGGSLFNGNKPTFDSPENVRAVKQYVDFVGKDKVAAPQNAQYSTGTQAPTDFANKKVAMIMFQTNTMNVLKSAGMKEGEYGVSDVPIPASLPAGGEPIMSHTAGINLSIFKNTQNMDEALKFVEFMTSKDQQAKLNQDYVSIPVTEVVAKEPAFETGKLAVFDNVYAHHSAPMPRIKDEAQMETLIGGAIKRLFAKAASSGTVTEGDVKSELAAANQKMAASSGGG
jgi:multiple sugar transport system substrate-binding protein